MEQLTDYPNIGEKLQSQLSAVGINTFEQLQRTGSKKAWLAMREIDASACYNRLCALEGAIRGVRWHLLPDSVKQELRSFYHTQIK